MRLSILLFLAAALSLDAQTIRGRIVDADAKPVAGARIQVALAERTSLDFVDAPEVLTSDDGRYEIAAPPFEPTERASLLVTLPAHAPVRSAPFAIATAGSRAVDVTLPRFERMTVRVVDPNDKPMKDARIVFAPADETAALPSPRLLLIERFAHLSVKTGEDGTAAVFVTPGTWDFAVKADGYQAWSGAAEAKPPHSILAKLEQAFTIRGRIHRNDVGVADAHVFLVHGERVTLERERAQIATDKDGAFEVRDLPPGKYTLRIMKPAEVLSHTVEAKAPSTIDVALPGGGTLRARVIDAETREPLREFLLTIGNEERTESQAGGVAAMTLTAGTYRIGAAAVGYTPADPVDVRVRENEETEIVIALDRGISVSGRVTDERDDPVAGAAVYLESQRRRPNRMGPNNAVTAADGSFTITGLTPGTGTATVRKEGFVPFLKAIEIESMTTLDVQLSRGLTIEGIVRRGGKPLPNVQIDASTQALGGAHQAVTSDANGRFALTGLVAARYTVAAFTEDANTEVRDVDPTKTRELALSLDPNPTGVLYGIVTGIPASQGPKVVRRAVFVEGRDRGVETMIGDDGSYRFEAAPVGTIHVTAQFETTSGGRSSARKRVELVAGQPLRLDLDLGAATIVRGRVTADAKPLAGVSVIFNTASGIAASAVSRVDGAYEVALAEPGRYQIFAHAETLTNGAVQLVRDIRGGETVDIEVREQHIEGIVTDAVTQQPLSGVFVTLTPELPMANYYGGEAITDANGRFHLLTAASGAYRIVAWARGYAQRAMPVQLGRGATPPLAIELAKTSELRVRVLDAKSGTPLGAHVEIENVPVRLEREADGVTLAGSLAPGRYRLRVVVAGYEDRVIDVTAPGSVEVRME